MITKLCEQMYRITFKKLSHASLAAATAIQLKGGEKKGRNFFLFLSLIYKYNWQWKRYKRKDYSLKARHETAERPKERQ